MGVAPAWRRGMGGAWWWAAMAALAVVLAMPAGVLAQPTYPAKPAERGAGGFIADEAKLVSDADAKSIRDIAERLLTDKRVPIIVCTITSLAAHNAEGWGIERYAMNLYDEWGIGSQEHNYGMLLLVSKGDRKARIELGRGWSRDRDAAAKAIMDRDIVPKFKQGDFSGGILAGVRQLDSLGRIASTTPAPGSTSTGGGSSGTGAGPAGSAGGTPAPSSSSTTSGAASSPAAGSSSRPTSPPQPYPGGGYGSSGGSGSSRGSGMGGLMALPLTCLFIPLIGIFVLISIVKRIFGFGGRWGGGMYPGGYRGGYGGYGMGGPWMGGGGATGSW